MKEIGLCWDINNLRYTVFEKKDFIKWLFQYAFIKNDNCSNLINDNLEIYGIYITLEDLDTDMSWGISQKLSLEEKAFYKKLNPNIQNKFYSFYYETEENHFLYHFCKYIDENIHNLITNNHFEKIIKSINSSIESNNIFLILNEGYSFTQNFTLLTSTDSLEFLHVVNDSKVVFLDSSLDDKRIVIPVLKVLKKYNPEINQSYITGLTRSELIKELADTYDIYFDARYDTYIPDNTFDNFLNGRKDIFEKQLSSFNKSHGTNIEFW